MAQSSLPAAKSCRRPFAFLRAKHKSRSFRAEAGVASEMINDDQIELQPGAMKALLKAREEALKENLDITPA